MSEKTRQTESENIIKSFFDTSEAVDYKSIKALKQRAGVTLEYLKECEKIHREKDNSRNQANNR